MEFVQNTILLQSKENVPHTETQELRQINIFTSMFVSKQNARNSYKSSYKNTNTCNLINNTLKMVIEMVLEKKCPSVFSLVLCSPFQAPFGSSGWWLMASLSPQWVQLHNHHPDIFAGRSVMFTVGVPSSSVLGPAWVYFYVFPCPGLLPSGCFQLRAHLVALSRNGRSCHYWATIYF